MSEWVFSSGTFSTVIPNFNITDAPHGWDYERFVSAAGFNSDDEEVGVGVLSQAWGDFAVGTYIVCGCTVEGHDYTVAYKNGH